MMAAPTGDTSIEKIENKAFNATKLSGFGSAVTALAGAVAGVIGLFEERPQATVVAALAVVAVGLIAIAIVVSSDIRARAAVGVASLQFPRQASASTVSGPQSASGESHVDERSAHEFVVVSTGAKMGVTRGDEIYTVLAIRVHPKTEETRFLVAQRNSLPRWYGREELDDSVFEFNAQGFPVREPSPPQTS